MFFYLLLFVLAFICAGSELSPFKNRWVLAVPFVALMFAMVAFRDGLGGSDYTMYTYFYSKVVALPDFLHGEYVPHYRTKSFEVGFVTLASIVRWFDSSKTPYVFMFVVAVIDIVLLFVSTKKYTKFLYVAMLFYLYKAYFWHDFTLLRQSIAIGLFMYSIQYIKSREMVKYMALNLLGMTLHASAVVLLPLYFVVNKRWNDLSIVLIIAVAFLLNALGPYLFYFATYLASLVGMADRFDTYFNARTINPLNFLEIMLILFVAMYGRVRLAYAKKEPYFDIFLNIFVVSSFLIIAFSSFEIFARFKEYFVVSYMVLCSYFIGHIENKRSQMAAFLLYATYCFLGYVRYLYTFDAGGLIPYKWL